MKFHKNLSHPHPLPPGITGKNPNLPSSQDVVDDDALSIYSVVTSVLAFKRLFCSVDFYCGVVYPVKILDSS